MEQGTLQPSGAGHLLDDLIIEILIRLPARSVCRFRTVSKSWHALATDARAPSALAVISAQTTFSKESMWEANVDAYNFSFFRDVDPTSSGPAGRDDVDHRSLRALITFQLPSRTVSGFVGSWDGDVCVEIRTLVLMRRGLPVDSYVLFNPLTRACTVVPAPAAARYGVVLGAYAHPVTGVFHLLHSCLDEGELSARILKVDDDPVGWREIPEPSDSNTASVLQRVYENTSTRRTFPLVCDWRSVEMAATLRGKLHWLHVPDSAGGHSQLLVFDMLKGEFVGTIQAPQQVSVKGVLFRRISEVSGKLCLFFLSPSTEKVEIWVLEDYEGQRWKITKRSNAAPLSPRSSLMAWLRSSQWEDEEIVLRSVDNISVYRDVQLRRLRDTSDQASSRIKMHQESLVPAEVAFGASARVVPHTYPGIPLFLSSVDDFAIAICPRVPLADVGRFPRGGWMRAIARQ